ncbi:hypothetical protein HMPREF2531_02896 [Bacteroides intestinalis]|uniref:Uncharacterized protein n=1 Tax=Bacteroides intestinalis TaxID=329854 RepID=A0A139LAZ0_9BACE|nr:hypothetical protein HMPREF2531_02896 [Bacteroides intestinalis]
MTITRFILHISKNHWIKFASSPFIYIILIFNKQSILLKQKNNFFVIISNLSLSLWREYARYAHFRQLINKK